ncbi:MAG: hypothetical protein CMH59_12665 [Myxococcales bacterium]|nr:hypothetical protein [Myxococcales bacterium]
MDGGWWMVDGGWWMVDGGDGGGGDGGGDGGGGDGGGNGGGDGGGGPRLDLGAQGRARRDDEAGDPPARAAPRGARLLRADGEAFALRSR